MYWAPAKCQTVSWTPKNDSEKKKTAEIFTKRRDTGNYVIIVVVVIINEYCVLEDEQSTYMVQDSAVNLQKVLQRRWLFELSLKVWRATSGSHQPGVYRNLLRQLWTEYRGSMHLGMWKKCLHAYFPWTLTGNYYFYQFGMLATNHSNINGTYDFPHQ